MIDVGIILFAGSTLTELPIRGQTFGPDANIQLRLIQGQEFVSLDQRTKKLVLEKELDRDQVSQVLIQH